MLSSFASFPSFFSLAISRRTKQALTKKRFSKPITTSLMILIAGIDRRKKRKEKEKKMSFLGKAFLRSKRLSLIAAKWWWF
jgi:hypothetical protein